MQPNTKYDIMIENIIKEYNDSMSNQSLTSFIKPRWEEPQYSGNQIEKAGRILSNPSITDEERSNALKVLNNWRASHAYPLQIICDNLRKNNPNAIVVQRLKRLDSIIGKLKRFPQMNLYRMQDLGGCRVIVDSIDDVYHSLKQYKKSSIRHILRHEYDYIKEPKESGYRSYHMVYQYHSDKIETYNKNILIEIQFRTKLQHLWATALETMGVYTKTALKASMGDQDVLRFFVLVSSVFAQMEKMPICPNTSDNYNTLISEIKEIDSQLNIVSRLSALSVAIKKTNEEEKFFKSKRGYYLLQLRFNERRLSINAFPNSQIDLATKIYNQLESVEDSNIDYVLVSASSFNALKAAYPNYFADIGQFIEIMNAILK